MSSHNAALWKVKSHQLFLPRCVQNLGVIMGETLMIFAFILACIHKVYDARIASGVFNETLGMVINLQVVFMTAMLQGLAWTARDMPPFGALLYMSCMGFEATILTIAHLFPFLRALYSHRLNMDPHTSSMHNVNATGIRKQKDKQHSSSIATSEAKQNPRSTSARNPQTNTDQSSRHLRSPSSRVFVPTLTPFPSV
jgi:hypothetical protein